MTLPPSEGAAAARALSVSAETKQAARTALDSLTIALEAAKLAIELADDAPLKANHGNPTPSQIFENWHAATVLVHEVFDNLYYEARSAVGLIKPMLGQD
jgi:hypothetical protein